MQRRMRGKRLGGKPVETAIVDNDGIYDPDCDATGQFRTKQCNNTEVCWCVNSAGVRRSDKGDKGIECEQAETYWVRLDLTHTPPTSPIDSTKIKAAIDTALQQRYQLEKGLVKDVQYDENANLMVVDVKKDIGDRVQDLSRMTYYLMKDVKESPLFRSKSKLQVNIDGQNVTFKDVVIYYVDEKAPTFTMKRVTGGIIAVIVVVILVLIGGLLILYFIRKREEAMYSKGQERQMDNVQN
ncbi:epithelial cell adhesion molecule-like [Scleropages formosus]|nr:epithelial cell adhesion molecule-like [Scleropages formosus]